MSSQSTATRQRLVQAALELFLSQGVSNTTTRQIANFADVNEVTLFRHFGNKYGLLLAVIQESPTFAQLGQSIIEHLPPDLSFEEALKCYASSCLHALQQAPDFIRSLIGEADQYPIENRRALGDGLTEANRFVAQYFEHVIQQDTLFLHLSPDLIAGLLHGLLIGYAMIELTSDLHELWQNQGEFLDQVVNLFMHGAVAPIPEPTSTVVNGVVMHSTTGELLSPLLTSDRPTPLEVRDLPASLVHLILQQARKAGLQDYALAYVLFGAGLSPTEIARLQRSHQTCDPHQHILQVSSGTKVRQVTVNQWILGKRYGSYTTNPLTKWLKTRKDEHPSMFLDSENSPITPLLIQQRWQTWVDGLVTPQGQPPSILQAQQTWCVEMVMRGMSLENLSILTGWDLLQLQPYAYRAREKAALEEAALLDRKAQKNQTKVSS
jgi:AcrR family transcriptional regulator